MQTFKNLKVIDPDRNNLVEFMGRLQKQHNHGWTFQEDSTIDYARNIFKDFKEVAVFLSPEICDLRATVWLILEGLEVRIANIVPKNINRLTYDQYNLIFDQFVKDIIKPIAKDMVLDYIDTPAQLDLEMIIGKETMEKLEIWEITCNSDSGNAHPKDFERWADFIITAFLYRSKIDAQLLERWLIEDRGWADLEVINRLGADFDYGFNLLEYYEDNR